MKREYTLLTLGTLIAIASWIGLTNSLRSVFFTVSGLLIMFIAYQYRNEKNSGKLQSKVTKSETPLPEPEIVADGQELEKIKINHESKHHTKHRI